MHNSILTLRILFLLITLGLFACSSGGGGSDDDDDDDDTEVPVAPVLTSIVSGDGVIDITWTHEDEPAGDQTDGVPVLTYNLYYANATANDITIDDLGDVYTTVEIIEAQTGVEVVEAINALSYQLTGLDNLSLYYFVLTAINEEGEGDTSVTEGYAMPRASVVTSQTLADTGTTLCGDYAFGVAAIHDADDDGALTAEEIDVDGDEQIFESDNRIDCAVGDEDDDLDPLPAIAQQDYSQGLDNTANDDSDGIAGFSYTKLDATGTALAADATEWSCVQDNVTGLIWESKSAVEDDLHYSGDLFSWYNEDSTLNGEESGYEIPSDAVANDDAGDDICFGYTDGDTTTYCNTAAFVDRVNTEALCGYADWRLPNLVELRSLVHYGQENEEVDELIASVDLSYFPNTEIDGGIDGTTIDGGVRYWASQTFASVSTAAWSLYYGYGGAPALDKGTPSAVRLVRSGP